MSETRLLFAIERSILGTTVTLVTFINEYDAQKFDRNFKMALNEFYWLNYENESNNGHSYSDISGEEKGGLSKNQKIIKLNNTESYKIIQKSKIYITNVRSFDNSGNTSGLKHQRIEKSFRNIIDTININSMRNRQNLFLILNKAISAYFRLLKQNWVIYSQKQSFLPIQFPFIFYNYTIFYQRILTPSSPWLSKHGQGILLHEQQYIPSKRIRKISMNKKLGNFLVKLNLRNKKSLVSSPQLSG